MSKLQTEFSESEQSPGLALWQVTNKWQAAVRAALKPFGLTHVQFVLLASLTWLDSDEPVTQKQLADHAATDPMMTSQVLRSLEQAELLVREPHPSDGRAFVLSPTKAGTKLVNRAIKAVEQCDKDFFAPLGSKSSTFAATLRSLL